MRTEQTTSMWVEGGAATWEEGRATAEPAVVAGDSAVEAAIAHLDSCGQIVGFVECSGRYVGVITIEDLRFTQEWAGPQARVEQALTCVVVEVSRDADLAAATDAFCNGLRDWVAAHAAVSA